MKSTRLTVMVMLVVLCAFSWMILAKSAGRDAAQAGSYTRQAAEYQQKRLYQLALENYQQAIRIEPSKERYDALIATCQAYLEEDPDSQAQEELLAAYGGAAQAYPQETGYWEQYVQLYVTDGDYNNAYKALRQADRAGAESETLAALLRQVRYHCDQGYEAYEQISQREAEGLYIVTTGGLSGAVEADGSQRLPLLYSYVGAAGDEGVLLCVTQEGETQLFDGNGVMIARFAAVVEQAMGCAENRIPARLSGRSDWCYLDYDGNEICGGFLQAGRFQDGRAAVQNADGSWGLIDENGAPVSETTWEEIRLDGTGCYLQDGVMLAKSGGSWMICDEDGKPVSEFRSEDIDRCCDGEPIAFCQSGQWGFVDTDGTVLIQPSYTGARSFSDGVAAVCTADGWNFIDGDGNLVIQGNFADAGYFSPDSGSCPVQPDPNVTEWRLLQWTVQR